MKTIFLKSLKLYHFKGIKKLEINQFTQETEIAGKNGSGKTSIFDAFTFLMFGKDSHDRSAFNIKTLNDDGSPMNNIEHTVEGILEIDGSPVTLKKIYKENWVKKRGELEPELKGHTTLCYIDEVPKSITEFQAYISEIVDETIFKQITNPKYFANLPWKLQREILFTIAGTVSDAEIADGNKEYEALLEKLSGKKMADYLLQINGEKKKIKADLDAIPTRIDEVIRSKPEDVDFEVIEKEISTKKTALEAVDNSISDSSKAYATQTADNQKIHTEINALNTKKSDTMHKAKQARLETFYTKETDRKTIENNLASAQSNLTRFQANAKNIAEELESKNTLINTLRADFTTLSDTEYVAEEGKMICPVWNIACGDPKSLELHQKNKDKAKETFNTEKVAKFEAINKKGQDLKVAIAEIEDRLAQNEAFIRTAKEEITTFQNELANFPENKKPEELQESEVPEIVEINTEIDALKSKLKEISAPDNSELKAQKSTLSVEIETLQNQLSKREQIATVEKRVAELKAEQKKLSQLISGLEKDEFTINNFTRDRILECEARINGRFNLVKFKLFNTQVNGAENETCEMMVNGVPYSDVNTAASINAGLDVINVLSDFYGVTAPVFIDNRESVSDIIDTDAQIVNLVVDPSKEKLTIK